jgi:hypothetical protein
VILLLVKVLVSYPDAGCHEFLLIKYDNSLIFVILVC